MTPEGALSALEQTALRIYGNTLRLVLANKARDGLLVLPEGTEISPVRPGSLDVGRHPQQPLALLCTRDAESQSNVIVVYSLRARPSAAEETIELTSERVLPERRLPRDVRFVFRRSHSPLSMYRQVREPPAARVFMNDARDRPGRAPVSRERGRAH
jgi:hypothetical protein